MTGELLFPLVAVFGGIVGAIYDFRIREIPNWTNFFMLFFGVGGYLIISAANLTVWPFLYSMVTVLAFYGLAAIMYYSGQWGGGDAKMLIGFGALLPIYPAVLLRWFNPNLSFWPFPVTIFLNTIMIGGAIGLLTLFVLIFRNREKFVLELKVQTQRNKNWARAILLVLVIPLLSFFLGSVMFFAAISAWILLALLFFTFLAAKSVEKVSMTRRKKPVRLTEGDWLAEEVRISGKVIARPSNTGLKASEIKKLIRLEQQGRLKRVAVKDGIPFAPSFLLGLLASLIFGDLIFIIVGSFF